MNLCTIDGCGKPHEARGYCIAHYKRFRRHGDPLVTVKAANGEVDDFYQNVVLTYEGKDCLSWPFSTNNGYGRMRGGIVSRILCEDVYGPPPTPEHQAAHSCGKGHLGCVTKGHLSWKTPTENHADKVAHDTHRRGERSNLAKLTEHEAREILSLKGKEPQKSVAKRFGINQPTVSMIQSGRSWSWLQESNYGCTPEEIMNGAAA